MCIVVAAVCLSVFSCLMSFFCISVFYLPHISLSFVCMPVFYCFMLLMVYLLHAYQHGFSNVILRQKKEDVPIDTPSFVIIMP